MMAISQLASAASMINGFTRAIWRRVSFRFKAHFGAISFIKMGSIIVLDTENFQLRLVSVANSLCACSYRAVINADAAQEC